MPQAPPEHAPVALAGAQTLPHPPQCGSEVPRLASHPSVMELLQSPKPERHAPPQVPATQSAVALGGAAQMVPQARQLDGSVLRFTQLPEQ